MTMTRPQVSVGMPVFNDPEGLRRSVPTVFGQTWPGRVHLIVVDDGSTDDTPYVLEELAATYDTIEIVSNSSNRGRPAARNTIIEHAGDDYLAWLDAGDLWHPRALDLRMSTLLSEEERFPTTPLLCTGPVRWRFDDRAGERIRVPDVSGDQLYNALTGTLFPYLQAIAGKAEHFRAAGGFDERLLRRQDYDFLVRFIGAGGRVVSTPQDVPLFTYLKSDIGGSAAVVARSNRIIRHKHRSYYRQYEHSLSRQIHASQRRLVARFNRNNGKRVAGLGQSAMAELASGDPAGTVRRSVSMVKRALRRILAKATRLVRWAEGHVLRRPRLIAFARRIGLLRLVARIGIAPANDDRIRIPGAGHGRFSPWPSTPEGTQPPAIDRLEHLAATADAGQDPDIWLRLEQAYRSHGLLHSAQSALERGLEHHPKSQDLRVRLIELLSLRKQWQPCVDLWAAGADLDPDKLRSITHTRVARALRHLQDHKAAQEVATEGARRWPDDPRLLNEISMSRAALVDWSSALTPSVAPGHSDGPIGAVYDLGFLIGADRPASGRITVRSPHGGEVALNVNDVAVATTRAAGADDDALTFALSCHDLLNYLGDGDVISATCDGRPLTFADDSSTRCMVSTGYPSRFGDLHKALRSGYVFTKFGVLRAGNTAEHKADVLALYEVVAGIVAESHGYTCFPFYGNLLGAIREHDFIGHDVGGFDMGYVSRHQHPDKVRGEFLDICRTLLARGYHLKLEPWSTYVRPTRNSPVFVDLNYAWFSSSDELHLSFGWRWEPVTDRERVAQPRTCPIGSHLVAVPGNAEDILRQIYGPTWAVPDQGFSISAGLQRDDEYLLTVDEMTSMQAVDPDRVEAILDDHPELER